jgi:hypothetical protein
LVCWLQEIGKTDLAKEFFAHPVNDGVGNRRSITCRVNDHAEGPLAEGRIDNVHHCGSQWGAFAHFGI